MRKAVILAALLLAACGPAQGGTAGTITAALNVNLLSDDFPPVLPAALTCDGAGRPPAMTWSDPPPTTRSLVVELVDTEAPSGIFAHWLVYDIPSGARGLTPPLPASATEGRNGYGATGYGPICPPHGQTHIYLLTVYATTLDPTLPGGLTRTQLDDRIRPAVIGMGQLEGTYSRR
ncbi:MAG TPA: YbhB/YbcL family Raf kinase inhibitor-like protein [Thermoleophilia bacterium]|nr:YbhB/YbcL family Raf kinase inhibitor-like protein [Thermoleophilia bacterium]